eukprot:scaffold883_cov131-Alexandrium_tamarense.AAC.1
MVLVEEDTVLICGRLGRMETTGIRWTSSVFIRVSHRSFHYCQQRVVAGSRVPSGGLEDCVDVRTRDESPGLVPNT